MYEIHWNRALGESKMPFVLVCAMWKMYSIPDTLCIFHCGRILCQAQFKQCSELQVHTVSQYDAMRLWLCFFSLSLSSFVRLYESVKSFFLLLLDYHLKCIKWRIVYVHCSLPILIPFTSATFSLTYEKMPHIYCLEWLPTRKIERKSGYLSFYTISNK